MVWSGLDLVRKLLQNVSPFNAVVNGARTGLNLIKKSTVVSKLLLLSPSPINNNSLHTISNSL